MHRGAPAALLLAAAAVAASPALTPTERRWLQGLWPVVEQAQAQGMPLDIVVQPQPTPGLAPLALAWLDGRCKLVLSMRGHGAAEAALSHLDPALADAALALMAAHEIGHCHRHVQGAWQARGESDGPQAERREEAFGDLVGLAWVLEHRPRQYRALHAWLVQERSREAPPGSAHDTLPWLRQVADEQALAGPGSAFERAARLLDAASVDLGAR